MSGTIKGIQKFHDTETDEDGILYCDGNGNFTQIDEKDLIWNKNKTKCDTKKHIKGISIKDNNPEE